jgi:nicotinate dehydrogenase subunit B
MKRTAADDFAESASCSPGILDRRDFIKLLGPGLYVFFSFEEVAPAGQERSGGRGYPSDFNAYLRIGEDGRVSCFTGKVEMGQGIIAALAQMLAEELEVSYDSIRITLGDTRLCPWDGGTNGSRSIKYFGPALRAAGAEAREVLLQMAAEQLRVPRDRVAAKNGVVSDRADPARKIGYGALAKGKTIERHLEAKPAVKPPSAFAVCGKSLPRPDLPEKVTGRAKYAGDIRLPGMLYGRVLRPPAHGARLKNVDASAARTIQDAQILQDGDFVAVVHPLPDMAEKALSLIKAEYAPLTSDLNETNIHQHLMKLPPRETVVESKGDLAKGRELAALKFEETYMTPYVAHAPMETHTAVAQVEGDGATLWIGTQRPFGAQEEIARLLGLPADKVRVITPYLGGGYGGKSQIGQAVQAARLSKMTGRPVQVFYTREDEFFYDTFMPAAVVTIGSGLDASNRIVFWDYRVLFAGERSSQNIYDVPHLRTTSCGGFSGGGNGPHPFGTGAWRGPGSNTNIFARESHINIMASRVGVDPVEFRLKNLADARMIRVLRAAAEKFGWKPARPPSKRGYGVVCFDYLGTYAAAMAEINLDRTSGRIRVLRVVHAQDMGPVINPDGARMQIEGCVAMGLGYCLSEEIHFRGGEIKDLSFSEYAIPQFSWVPKVEAVLVENHEIPPSGGGEPPIVGMGALIANALYDASGVRLNRLPLTPERIKEKL